MNINNFIIEAGDLLDKIDDPNLRIFDASIAFYMGLSPEEAAKMPTAHEQYLAGRIPGAAFFDHLEFSDVDSRYEYYLGSDEEIADQIGKHGIAIDSEVVIYTTGILACATRAWWLLRYAGVEKVRVLNGGLAAWKEAGGILEQGESHYEPVSFTPDFKSEMFASMKEVQAATQQDEVNIENALTLEWHNMEHIPGSTCLPLTDLTIGWETFIPEDQLVEKLKHTLQHERIINYCGGGIAASLNAMAHLIAGHKNVAVYDGSLFEWKGEGLPIETTN
jgi:thiosulfate/3-mercaptopyruvate sulfurtransferase